MAKVFSSKRTVRPSPHQRMVFYTFTPEWMQALKDAHPWAACTVIRKLLEFNGPDARLNLEQQKELEDHGLLNHGDVTYEHLVLRRWVGDGMRLLDVGSEEALRILDILARSAPEPTNTPKP